ncbi:MAG: hypothetical protein ABEJ78_12085 [Haloferacaceae archaeon]
MDTATRVVVSYPDELSDWGRRQVTTDHFRTYLRRAHDEVHAGDVWEEFVDVGCCGDTLDVPLRVESVDGPPRMGAETTLAFVEREASLEGGWHVQSAAGPE